MALAASDDVVVWGHRVTLTGQLDSDDSSCVDDEVIAIERRVHGTTTRETFASAVTDETGHFSVTFRGRESADYYAVATQHDQCDEAMSSPVTVRVRVALSISTDDRRVRRGTTIDILATVTPDHDGTKVVLQRKKAGRFVNVVPDRVDGGGRAEFTIPVDWRGPRTFRVKWPTQDDEHRANNSRNITIEALERRRS